jgi:hypothetical protein
MSRKTVHIEQLQLRVPGMSRTQAARFGEEVARGLQQGLERRQVSERVGSVSLRLTAPQESPRNGLAALVAERILLGLRR